MALKIAPPEERVTGAAMDQPLPKRRGKYLALSLGALALASGVAAAIWQLAPNGLQVAEGSVRTATAQQGMLRNDIVVRATAAPLHTTMLDATESGRVEEVLAGDGTVVKKGELLFRLSNSQRRLELVAREADRAQQISNLSNLRVALEASQTEHQRRLLDINFALAQAQRLHTRNQSLAEKNFISASTLEESRDQLALQQHSLDDEKQRVAIEMRIKRDGVQQMEQAIGRLDAGLRVVNESIEALAVRAPVTGRLTDFRLQLGEIVKPDQHIGRIDDPSQFKLTAQIDEYYLGSVSVGKPGRVQVSGRDYAVRIRGVFPQIKDGRFSVELVFTGEVPDVMNPGQSVETRITLGQTSPGLILPNDAYLNDSGGSWVFVLAADGRSAERRAIRIGRRNNSQVEVAAGLAPGERVIVSSYAPYGKAETLQLAK
ncbi:HlyD family efflux transporter periplasmic adaptor subunit [Janthinobacterium sp. SUN120]|uniref:efflux RND transporter periplasmic adaptor subunit n=1 Tax=Janthinobacterium sp. SUN120 TaxID=3004099 RepID=UPI0025B16E5E|nr:HlyD family efflux transporter periplasmic adaptor subunit [Janthinobacterium sp. SUN120]MDN2715188.1 HlyD family efflux transporter periplasmic adaptor subunit [Janthinobacterium sp. SUN120]